MDPTDRHLLIETMRRHKPHSVLIETEPDVFNSYARAGQEVCDFCNGEGPFECFETEPFSIVLPDCPMDFGDMDGKWAACPACARLIRAGARQELAEHAAAAEVSLAMQVLPVSTEDRQAIIEHVRLIQDGFWSHKK